MKKLFTIILFCSLASSSSDARLVLQDSVKVRRSETEGKSYKVQATVKKIYKEENKITLKHGAIKGYMPAMTMTFPVRKASLLDNLHEGSKGIFTIFVFKGFPSVTGVKLASAKHGKAPKK
jgi:Cu/Ag efflux protein CusF